MNPKDSSHRFYLWVLDRTWKKPYQRGLTSAGFEAQLRGFNVGVEIHGTPGLMEEHYRDTLTLFVTGGSEKLSSRAFLARIVETEDGLVVQVRKAHNQRETFTIIL